MEFCQESHKVGETKARSSGGAVGGRAGAKSRARNYLALSVCTSGCPQARKGWAQNTRGPFQACQAGFGM